MPGLASGLGVCVDSVAVVGATEGRLGNRVVDGVIGVGLPW